jgi:hypothetical protein
LGDAHRSAFLTRYEALLALGLAATPPPERQPRPRAPLKQSPARNLLERLLFQQDQVLAFLDDFTIPFDNNQAEQDLRMLKVQQKIAGSCRADTGSEAFARIRGYLSSMRKQGVALLTALQTVFTGQPQIGQEQVNRFALEHADGAADVFGDIDVVFVFEQTPQSVAGMLFVIDNQNRWLHSKRVKFSR